MCIADTFLDMMKGGTINNSDNSIINDLQFIKKEK